MADQPPYPDIGVRSAEDRPPSTPRWVKGPVQPLREAMQSFRTSPVFVLAVLLTLGTAVVIGLMTFVMILQPGFLGMGHFADPSHRIHEITFGILFMTSGVGLLAQLRRPSKNGAGMLMALTPWAGMVLAAVLSTDVFRVLVMNPSGRVAVAAVITALLYPAWRHLFRSFRVSRVNWVMLGLVIIAAVPLLVFASTNIGLQRTVTDAHAAQGHYGFMAALAFTVVGVGLLASLRPDGWWLPAWGAGLLAAFLAVLSLVYPENASSLGLVWVFAAIGWGVAFVAAAELTQDAERPTLLGSWGIIPALRGARRVTSEDDSRLRPGRGLAGRTPLWVNGLKVIALVPILLIFLSGVDAATGGSLGVGGLTGDGGPGGHRPGPPAGGHGPGGDEGNSPVADGADKIAVTGDNLAFDPGEITVTAGDDVAIVLTSADTLHDFTVDELDAHVAAGPGETATGGFRAEQPGRYTFYCSVPGHRQAGMEGTLIVEAPGEGTVEGPVDPTPASAPHVTITLVPIIHLGAFVDARDTRGAQPNPTLRVPLGSVVQVTLENHMGGEFDIYFPDFEAKSERVMPGSATTIVFVADRKGEFVYYSTVLGHREAGLEGRIVVGE